MWRATSAAWNPRPPGAPAGLRTSPSAPNSLTTSDLAGERGLEAIQPAADRRVDPRGRRVQVRVPALVVRAADHVDRAVDRSGAGRQVLAPDVDGDRPAGVEPVREPRRPRRHRRLAARAVGADLVGQVPGQTLGCARSWSTLRRARRTATRIRAGVVAAHSPGWSTGPMPCQTRIPAASRRSSSGGLSGCCARVALACRWPQARHQAVHVRGRQRIAAARRVLLQRDAAQAQRPAVEQQAPLAAQLAQPDARR